MTEIFSVFGVDWQMILVQVFNFGLLLGILWYFLYTPVLNLLSERQEKIEKGVKDAEAAARERALAGEEKQTIVGKAVSEAGEIVDSAKKKAEEERSRIVSEGKSQSDAILKEAEIRAEEERKGALKSAEGEVAKMIVLGVERVLRERA